MEYHPLAEIFPMIEGAEYDSLVEDIRLNGLHEPIWIYEDKILDGRNRWRACKDAKIEPKTREYRGKDALSFIVSLNLKRRHLSESQRGMVGARLLAILKEKNDNGIKVLAATERWDRERELKEISESDLPYDVKHEQMGNLKERWNKKDRTSINESLRVIYLMSDGDRMKVGVTSQAEIRLKSLKTSIPNLKLEKTWPGGFLEEKDLHKALKSFSCGGEWYSKTNESLAIVNEFMQSRKNADVHIPILKTASKIMNVGGRSIESAKQVIERGTPELVRAVDSGKMPVSVAARLTKATPEKQREVAKDYETKATATELKAHVALATGENEWYTPHEYIAAARKVMGGIDCDPASSEKANKIVKAATYFTQENDGLNQKWHGRVWMNPPYSRDLIAKFSEAIAKKFMSGEIKEACILVNNATETSWFRQMSDIASAICFPENRIRFIDINGERTGAPLQGQAIIYLGKNIKSFEKIFKEKGSVWGKII